MIKEENCKIQNLKLKYECKLIFLQTLQGPAGRSWFQSKKRQVFLETCLPRSGAVSI